jgi:hypothetical protein
MRNDARPIGEVFRDIAEHDRHESPAPEENPAPSPDTHPAAGQARARNTPFVTKLDPGDEELPLDTSDR